MPWQPKSQRARTSGSLKQFNPACFPFPASSILQSVSSISMEKEFVMLKAESNAELNPFEEMVQRFNIAAARLKLDDGLYQVLLTPDREIGVAIPVQMDNGSLRVFKG